MEADLFLNLSLPANLSPQHVHSMQWRHNISRTGVHILCKIIFKQEAWNKLSQQRLIRESGRGYLTKGDGGRLLCGQCCVTDEEGDLWARLAWRNGLNFGRLSAKRMMPLTLEEKVAAPPLRRQPLIAWQSCIEKVSRDPSQGSHETWEGLVVSIGLVGGGWTTESGDDDTPLAPQWALVDLLQIEEELI
jgi:hypothetical protein